MGPKLDHLLRDLKDGDQRRVREFLNRRTDPPKPVRVVPQPFNVSGLFATATSTGFSWVTHPHFVTHGGSYGEIEITDGRGSTNQIASRELRA